MKVLLEDRLHRTSADPIDQDTRVPMPLAGGCVRLMWSPEEASGKTALWVNQRETPLSLAGLERSLTLPCQCDQEGSMSLRIQGTAGDSDVYHLYRERQGIPETEQAIHLADFRDRLLPLFAKRELSAGNLFQAIETGRLPLMAILTPRTGEEDGCLREIEAALPHLMHVCNRPHTRLRDNDQVRPVSTVRRTGPATLQHIASHSEHWEARTFLGLRPARLLARTVTDDLELYENRVVFCLLIRLQRHLHRLLAAVAQARAQRQTAFDLQKLAEDPFFYQRWELLERLFGKDQITAFDADRDRFERYETRLLVIQNTLAQCTLTPFFTQLKHTNPVHSPLKPTNILRMDPHYGPLFRLWRTLDEEQKRRQEAVDGALPEECQTLYSAFCQVLILEALHQDGFIPLQGDKEIVLHLAQDHSVGTCYLTVSAEAMFRKSRWSVQIRTERDDSLLDLIHLQFQRDLELDLPIPAEVSPVPDLPAEMQSLVECQGTHLRFHACPTSEQFDLLEKLLRPAPGIRLSPNARRSEERWRGFINELRQRVPIPESYILLLIPVFTGMGGDTAELRRQTQWLLEGAAKQKEVHQADACVILLPETARASESGQEEWPWELWRRTNTLGDTFSPLDAKRWGDYSIGMFVAAQEQVVSVTRLVRLVRMHRLLREIRSGSPLTECPACRRNAAVRGVSAGRDGYMCHNCGARWNRVKCSSCNHNYGWIQPGERTKRQAVNMVEGLKDSEREHYGQWMEVLEHLSGDSSCSGFCEAANTPFTPLCPRCGFCSQSNSGQSLCLRCAQGGQM